LIARLTELHGRSSEVARRMMDDARILADVQRETSAVLLKLWNLRSEPTRFAPAESPSGLGMSAPSTPPNTGPRFLRFRELVKRVGLSRSSVWRLERAGEFPQHRRLSPNAVGWWEPEIDAWLRARRER
jgi:prophage regulatory protein